jgi:hypothetical protein
MLSAASFLHHLAHYCATRIVNPLVYTPDNLGLITRMKQRLQYDACYTNATLAPDWDLTEAIHASIQHLPSPTTFQHVKGHQDNHQKYSQLSLTAQLIVDANEAAGAFHWSHGPTHQESVPLYPTTKVHFNIGNKTITGHHKHHIRKAASRADFLEQCRILHGWDLPTFHTINLTIFRIAVRNYCHRHRFLFKLIHQVLPTQEQKSKLGPTTDKCPGCQDIDAQSHLLRCSSPSLTLWRKSFLCNLRSYLESYRTNLEVMIVILEAIEAWLDGAAINPLGYPRRCRRAITAQNRIGWHTFLQGYWTPEWSLLQDAHLKSTKIWNATANRGPPTLLLRFGTTFIRPGLSTTTQYTRMTPNLKTST